MGIWVKILTGSDGAAALTFFAYLAGLLLGPLTGMVIDRFRRRPMLIGVDLGAALWVCLLLAAGDGRLWLIYLVMFVYGVVSSLKFAAQAALLQEIAPVELLGEANSVLQVAEQGLRIVTPLLGAGLLTLGGPRPVILLNAVLFLLAAAGTTAIRHDVAAPVPSGERFWPEFTAGARFIRRTAALRVVVLSGVIALISAGLHQNVIWAVVDDGLHRPPAFVGVLQTASGIGAVLGGLVAAAVMRRTGERALMAAGLCAMTVAAVPLMLLSWTPTVVLAMALNGAGVVGVNVGEATLVQRLTPRALLGTRQLRGQRHHAGAPDRGHRSGGHPWWTPSTSACCWWPWPCCGCSASPSSSGRAREAQEPLEPATVDAPAATEAPPQR